MSKSDIFYHISYGMLTIQVLCLYSLSGKMHYRQMSWSLKVARLDAIMIVSLGNLMGISAALLPKSLSNIRAIGKVQTGISRLRDFSRSCGETSARLVNRGPDICLHISRVSCQNGPTRHAYAWQIGPFWQDILDIRGTKCYQHSTCWCPST